jgi:hypothetical protein
MKTILAAMVLGTMAANFTIAAPAYKFDHFLDTYNSATYAPGGNVGPQVTPIEYNFPYQSAEYGNRNYSEVHGKVGPGYVGIFDRAYNIGVYAPQRQEVVASLKFDVVFTSPNSDPIDVVMNFELDGTIQPALYLYTTMQVNAGVVSGAASSGEYREISDPASTSPVRSGMLASFVADGATQSISSGVLSNVPVNQPVQFYFGMHTVNPYTLENPTISFGNTLSLTTSGDVFTILDPNAELIEVNSADANVVNNHYVAVPEPTSFLLASIALLALLECRWCRSILPPGPSRRGQAAGTHSA